MYHGKAFFIVVKETPRFSPAYSRLSVITKIPHPNQIEELQLFYNSKDCSTLVEKHGVEQTYRNLIHNGYDNLKLFRITIDNEMVEVDLANALLMMNKHSQRLKKVKKASQLGDEDSDSDGISSGDQSNEDIEANANENRMKNPRRIPSTKRALENFEQRERER